MPRPNVRLVQKLDAFEQAMKDDPQNAHGNPLAALRRCDILLVLGIALGAISIAATGLGVIVWFVLGGRP